MNTFLATESDFCFEMQVLKELDRLGFRCEHGGSYQDPITKKIRQFDIRAERQNGGFRLGLAVECKNVRENCPLLITAVARTASEAFHQVNQATPIMRGPRALYPEHYYKAGEFVGKKVEQIRRGQDGSLTGGDADIFDKMSQAINSIKDLAERFCRNDSTFRTLLPVLIIPSSRLWQVDYGCDGTMLTDPRQVDAATLFVNHTWDTAENSPGAFYFKVSHLEIVTFPALRPSVERWFSPEGLFKLS